jgi:hypothetical protein
MSCLAIGLPLCKFVCWHSSDCPSSWLTGTSSLSVLYEEESVVDLKYIYNSNDFSEFSRLDSAVHHMYCLTGSCLSDLVPLVLHLRCYTVALVIFIQVQLQISIV